MITMSSIQESGRWRCARIIAAALLLALSLGGCSAVRLVYNQADALVYWWLDGHLDFDGAQTLRVREGITQWFSWHRRSQLPEYAALLERAATEAAAPTTPEQACRWFEVVRERADIAMQQVLPVAAQVAGTLHAEQLQRLARKQAESIGEFRREYLQPDAAERRAASVERAIERAEQLYGRLDAAQRAQVAAAVTASPFDPQRWLAERQRRQRDLLQALTTVVATRGGSDAARVQLQGVWQRARHSPDEAYLRYAEGLDRYNCEFAAQLHNTSTREQREALQRRLRGWETDLRRLASD
jgi:hypothetical protein